MVCSPPPLKVFHMRMIFPSKYVSCLKKFIYVHPRNNTCNPPCLIAHDEINNEHEHVCENMLILIPIVHRLRQSILEVQNCHM